VGSIAPDGDRLRARLRRESPSLSVRSSLPVLFFGDGLSARVATIGINPSDREYLNPEGELLHGRAQRFATLESLGAGSRAELNDEQADLAIEIMRSYYDDGKPVHGAYFRHLSNFLAGAGASYADRSAVHLDLVQEATSPVWGKLDKEERAGLLQCDLPFLVWQLNLLPRLRAAICAGATVSREVGQRVPVDVQERGTVKRLRWWLGEARLSERTLPVGGWNYPLDRPTGLGTRGELELGEFFARQLL
jgi:hypothetical protein